MASDIAVTLADVQEAARRIKGLAHQTPVSVAFSAAAACRRFQPAATPPAGTARPPASRPQVLTCSTLDALSGLRLHFKAEVFQKGGAFKFRGAANGVMALSDEAAAAGVVTHSSGNHGGAVALAAKMRGVPAHVVVPSNTPEIKRAAIREYGARLLVCEATIDAREAACAEVQRQHPGSTFIPPYNHPLTIAGQGTIALELLEQVGAGGEGGCAAALASHHCTCVESSAAALGPNTPPALPPQVPNLDAIIVPVSGGGMISGIAVAAAALRPGIKVIAAEPTGRNAAADVAASKAAGRPVALPKPATICDGLEARLGDLTWPIVRDLVADVVTVSEEEVVAAMKLVMERMKVGGGCWGPWVGCQDASAGGREPC